MPVTRRGLIRYLPGVVGGLNTIACRTSEAPADNPARAVGNMWDDVRAQFRLSPDIIDLSALYISSHPRPVREAIERHRRGLDENPTVYLESEISRQHNRVMEAAAGYLGGDPDQIALTDSTTMGLALVYQGFRLKPGQEFLVSDRNYYSTTESVRLAAARSGARVRYVSLYEDGASASVSAGQLVDSLLSGVNEATRVLAVTWVHSSTGVKLPIARIADRLSEINRERAPNEHVLLCVDAVHGFGVDDEEAAALGCDFYIAGCHKWLFGPRGTGIIWGSHHGWNAVEPSIPSFMDQSLWRAWMERREPSARTNGPRMSPGGFKPYEHQWAMAEAFEFHQKIGKANVAARTHELSRQLKEGLAGIPGVTLHTPMQEDLSSGIVCFEVRGHSPRAVVRRLRDRNIIATTTPYSPSYPRITPSIRNTPHEIETALRAIRELA